MSETLIFVVAILSNANMAKLGSTLLTLSRPCTWVKESQPVDQPEMLNAVAPADCIQHAHSAHTISQVLQGH